MREKEREESVDKVKEWMKKILEWIKKVIVK